ncbi:hypothetical protein NNJEOMEG_01212 [Fundidesulfovibrio magnetotacticus]|uniref:Uncharacterized protein n=1 Tax=Fundidesulfovibrio magnetotacticus TaxID=2730080 RepID=A0A6V8LQW4_9BACT|nr:hypothetical protein [Fundidesulfovibrio magnetotacticus]GFK93380.1 hypothetical protein NNJEOMEG_01212 [Fundidesulfovibrio magnetotacticus]
MTNDMSGVSGTSGATLDAKTSKQLFGAGVVKTTLDYMNAGGSGSGKFNADYDFQTKVLEGAYMAKGLNINGKV